METTIGGDRLGSGNKQQTSFRNYERSTHDLGFTWRSSMSSGTLVPFLAKLALPGDTWDIDLNCEVLTLPTVGPLFGSYKVQLDIFEVPMRLYNAKLHMNKLGIGMDMKSIFLPQIEVLACNKNVGSRQTFEDNEHINPSSILKYLGISGLGRYTGLTDPVKRQFNAVKFLAYWDIYKNYYSNKQEEKGVMIHTQGASTIAQMTPQSATQNNVNILGYANRQTIIGGATIRIQLPLDSGEPDLTFQNFLNGSIQISMKTLCPDAEYDPLSHVIIGTVDPDYDDTPDMYLYDVAWGEVAPTMQQFGLTQFPLENIDHMREAILQYAGQGAFVVNSDAPAPYGNILECNVAKTKYSIECSQEGLGIKTYQSDLFNNWINTEWIDGSNGVSELTKLDTSDGVTIDAINIAQKVYNMLNRIAVSGGTYDDWLDAVYTHERVKSIESPVYLGSLIKELAFQEVISKSETADKPLGTLAGRGVLTNKHKGGKVVVKVNEPSYIIGIVSLTPRIEYSQGNDWDMNLKTFDDFHKPALDAIGFQDLITDQLLWTDTVIDSATGQLTYKSLGKQPAWVNYMSSVNKTFGNFAIEDDSMFMTLNRRYTQLNGVLADPTTYIDPTKFNNIFAETSLDSQNFWTQIAVDITARRKMSAKLIPNL